MRILRTTLFILLVLFIGAAPTYAGSCFSKVIVFGDSNVDSGAENEYSLYNLTGGQIPGSPNVGGRSSNGPVVVEYTADMLGVPLENFGVGGAQTGEGNLLTFFLPYLDLDLDLVDEEGIQYSGVLSQLQMFEDLIDKKKSDKKALYILWTGSNDLYGATDDNLAPRINNALENIETTLVKLTKLGAKYILVATRTIRPEYYDPNNVNGVIFNARLRIRVQQLNAELKSDVQIFEAFNLISDMTYNPEFYGFVETTALCSANDDCIMYPEVADTYITWDDAHKTTRVHEIMAEALVHQALEMKGKKGKCSKKRQ